MIYKFNTAIEYKRLLISLHNGSGDYDKCLIWDLAEDIDICEVAISIHECRICCLAEVYFRDDEPTTKCYSCGGTMQCDQSVDVIIQGDTVVYRSDVFWYSSDGPVY